jgi:invasion protein IalB
MRNLVHLSVALLVFSPVVSSAAVAQAAQQEQQPAAKKVLDPNEVVCERQQETGSRLAAKRVCMTRSEWAEQRRQDRMVIEKIQTQRDLDH